MARYEHGLAVLQAAVAARRPKPDAPMSWAEWEAEITPRAQEARRQHRERIDAWEQEKAQYETYSTAQKIDYQRAKLTELDADIATGPAGRLLWNPKVMARRRRAIEIEIARLSGDISSAVAVIECALADEALSGKPSSGLECLELGGPGCPDMQTALAVQLALERGDPRESVLGAVVTAAQAPAVAVEVAHEPSRTAESDVARNLEAILERLQTDTRTPVGKRAPEPHKPPARPVDRLDGFRAADTSNLYFEPDT